MDLLPPPLPPLWDSERDDALTCVAVRAETHDVATFVFAPDEPRLFRFLPGQFAWIHTGRSPTASLSDAPRIPGTLTLSAAPT